jgi:hypothetical protein
MNAAKGLLCPNSGFDDKRNQVFIIQYVSHAVLYITPIRSDG